jgi:uncharacterized membrane protein YkoI
MTKRVLTAVVVFGALSAYAEEVKLEELPAKVRATIEKKVGNNKIEEIDREDRHGKIVFDVEYELPNGEDQGLLIAEDGKVIEEWRKSR